MKKCVSFILGAILSLSAMQATADVYDVDILFLGTFDNSSNPLEHDLDFLFLHSGDAGIFSSGLKTFIDGVSPLDCTPTTCTFVETFIGGDTITGHFNFNSFGANGASTTEYIYAGNLAITGGTGLFASATGSGTFSGADVFLTQTSGTTSHRSIYSVNTSPVPEPQTYAMLLVGLGLLGFAVKGKKQS